MYFHEKQKIKGIFFWMIFSISSLTIVGVMVNGLFNQRHGDESFTGFFIAALVLTVFIGAFIWAALTSELELEIKNRTIYYRFPPFVWTKRRISLESVHSARVIRYNPVKEYGGWGYRWRWKKGVSLNIGGKDGLEIIYGPKSKKVIIGTKKPEALKKVIAQLMKIKTERYA